MLPEILLGAEQSKNVAQSSVDGSFLSHFLAFLYSLKAIRAMAVTRITVSTISQFLGAPGSC